MEPTPEQVEAVMWALRAADDVVGPACMNVTVPPTIATDDGFREPYVQGYRHALADVRAAMNTEPPPGFTYEYRAVREGVPASEWYSEPKAPGLVDVRLRRPNLGLERRLVGPPERVEDGEA